MEIKSLHAELRAIVQGPKHAKAWEALIALLMPFYDALRTRAVGDDERALRAALAQLEEEVLPGLKRDLERSWPSPLRVVRAHHPLGIKALGGMVWVDLHPHVLSELLHQHGHKGSGELTPRALKVLPALCLEGLPFEGLRIDNVEALHVELMEAFWDEAPGALRHVRLRSVRGLGRDLGRDLARSLSLGPLSTIRARSRSRRQMARRCRLALALMKPGAAICSSRTRCRRAPPSREQGRTRSSTRSRRPVATPSSCKSAWALSPTCRDRLPARRPKLAASNWCAISHAKGTS